MKSLLMFSFLCFSFLVHADSSQIEFWMERGIEGAEIQRTSDGNGIIVEQDIVLPFSQDRGTVSLDARTWPNNTIIYMIDNRFSSDYELRSSVAGAILEIESKTNLRFKLRTSENSFVLITRGEGCNSQIGMTGGMQLLNLGQGCTSHWHTAAHELLHAAGILHEHTRSDRDLYINIIESNLGPLGKSNFTMLRHKTEGPFDFDSIMLYRSYAYYPFVLNPAMPMWVRKSDGRAMSSDNDSLSPQDVMALNKLYPKQVNPNPNPNPNPEPRKIQCDGEISFDNTRDFDAGLLNVLNQMDKCYSVTFERKNYSLDIMPERINDYLVAIKETGGSVKQIEVSRSIITKIIDWILSVIRGRDTTQIRKISSKMNAEIYYDKDSRDLIEVRFILR